MYFVGLPRIHVLKHCKTVFYDSERVVVVRTDYTKHVICCCLLFDTYGICIYEIWSHKLSILRDIFFSNCRRQNSFDLDLLYRDYPDRLYGFDAALSFYRDYFSNLKLELL